MKIGSLVSFTVDSGEKYLGIVMRYRSWDYQVKVLWFVEPTVPKWTSERNLKIICEGQNKFDNDIQTSYNTNIATTEVIR